MGPCLPLFTRSPSHVRHAHEGVPKREVRREQEVSALDPPTAMGSKAAARCEPVAVRSVEQRAREGPACASVPGVLLPSSSYSVSACVTKNPPPPISSSLSPLLT